MSRYHTHSISLPLPYPLPSPRCLWKHNDAVQFGVLTEMFTCMRHAWPLVVRLPMLLHGGAKHPLRLA